MKINIRKKLGAIVATFSLAVMGGVVLNTVGDTVSPATASAASCIRKGPTVPVYPAVETINVCDKFYYVPKYGGTINSNLKLVCPSWRYRVETATYTWGNGKTWVELKAKYCYKWI